MPKLCVFKSLLMSSLLILSACSNDDVANNNGKGSLTVAVKANQEVLSPITKSMTEETAPSVDDFSIFVNYLNYLLIKQQELLLLLRKYQLLQS